MYWKCEYPFPAPAPVAQAHSDRYVKGLILSLSSIVHMITNIEKLTLWGLCLIL